MHYAQVTSIQTGPAGQLGHGGQIRRLRISYDKAESGVPRLLVAMTPHEAPLVLTHWERFDKLSIR